MRGGCARQSRTKTALETEPFRGRRNPIKNKYSYYDHTFETWPFCGRLAALRRADGGRALRAAAFPAEHFYRRAALPLSRSRRPRPARMASAGSGGGRARRLSAADSAATADRPSRCRAPAAAARARAPADERGSRILSRTLPGTAGGADRAKLSRVLLPKFWLSTHRRTLRRFRAHARRYGTPAARLGRPQAAAMALTHPGKGLRPERRLAGSVGCSE